MQNTIKTKYQEYQCTLGISRKKIAEIIGVNRSTFSQMWTEKNGNSLKEKHLIKVQEYLREQLNKI